MPFLIHRERQGTPAVISRFEYTARVCIQASLQRVLKDPQQQTFQFKKQVEFKYVFRKVILAIISAKL